MDGAEEKFVRKFIKKAYRERCLFELSSPKKREEGIRQLSRKLKDNVIVPCGETREEIKKAISKTFDTSKNVYIISDSSIDGTHKVFEEAFETAMCGGWTYVLICDEDTVFLKDEDPGRGGGDSDKYVLYLKS